MVFFHFDWKREEFLAVCVVSRFEFLDFPTNRVFQKGQDSTPANKGRLSCRNGKSFVLISVDRCAWSHSRRMGSHGAECEHFFLQKLVEREDRKSVRFSEGYFRVKARRIDCEGNARSTYGYI